MEPDYSKLWGGKWSADMDAAPHDGTTLLGRLKGTNRSFDVHWRDGAWRRTQEGHEGKPVDIIEWISYRDFADTRHCVWNGGGRECFLPSKG